MLLPGHVGNFGARKGKGVIVDLQIEGTAVRRECAKEILEKIHLQGSS